MKRAIETYKTPYLALTYCLVRKVTESDETLRISLKAFITTCISKSQ